MCRSSTTGRTDCSGSSGAAGRRGRGMTRWWWRSVSGGDIGSTRRRGGRGGRGGNFNELRECGLGRVLGSGWGLFSGCSDVFWAARGADAEGTRVEPAGGVPGGRGRGGGEGGGRGCWGLG